MNASRLYVFRIDAVVANVRLGQRDNLLAVARVGQYFLVTGHGRVEHDFSDGLTSCADGYSCKDRAVCEREDGCRVDG